ncbi:MAG: helix-turn-helix domain-containing protein [Trebonia sp.]
MAEAKRSPPVGAKPRELTPEQRLRREVQVSGLPDGEVRLFVILVDKADFNSAIMHVQYAPTVAELERLCGKSRPTIFRRLKHLERHGWAVKRVNGQGGRKVVRVLQVGERCECPPHGGNRRKLLTADPTPTPTPTPTTVSSWTPEESHLGTENSLILKQGSAGQTNDSDYGASRGKDLRERSEQSCLAGQSSESWRSWSVGTMGWDANQGT